MVLEDRETGFVGAAVAVEKSGGRHIVVLEDRRACAAVSPWAVASGWRGAP